MTFLTTPVVKFSRMRKQWIPGPLPSRVGPGDEASPSPPGPSLFSAESTPISIIPRTRKQWEGLGSEARTQAKFHMTRVRLLRMTLVTTCEQNSIRLHNVVRELSH